MYVYVSCLLSPAGMCHVLNRETVRKVMRLHQWDVLRANKAPFAWGLEPRVPFLDKEFVALSMGMDPAEKMVRGACAESCVGAVLCMEGLCALMSIAETCAYTGKQ